jgi:hypothetical protein
LWDNDYGCASFVKQTTNIATDQLFVQFFENLQKLIAFDE